MSSSPTEPEGEEAMEVEETPGESFYAKILDVSRKKTNGEGAIDEDLELTPEEMKDLAAKWVGKKINLRHDLKGGFGKITAAWHTKDGKTHVRMTPGNTKEGKLAAEMIKKGELTSVSAGWKVRKSGGKDGAVLDKCTDHVALTNLPVYEGTVIYAMASQDQGISPDENGVLRTKGGLAVLPVMEDADVAVLVETPPRASKEVQETVEEQEGMDDNATAQLWLSLVPSSTKRDNGSGIPRASSSAPLVPSRQLSKGKRKKRSRVLCRGKSAYNFVC